MDAPKKPEVISYDDFVRCDIRVGTITKAEAVPKSEKLLKLEVFFGAEIGHRTIMAGIAKSFASPEAVVGQQVTAVLNLAPRKMMGVESHGMILAGHCDDGRVQLVTCAGVKDGGEIG